MPERENPSPLKPALLFGLLSSVVLLAVAAVKERGHQGLYVVAVLSGLTDVDAIPLSTSQLAKSSRLSINDS